MVIVGVALSLIDPAPELLTPAKDSLDLRIEELLESCFIICFCSSVHSEDCNNTLNPRYTTIYLPDKKCPLE
jgi:hypothetical protein